MIMRFFVYFSLGCLLFSCTKKELITYTEGDGIYFENNEILHDTVYVPWGVKPSDFTKQIIPLRVNLFGHVVDYDRQFEVEILPGMDSKYDAVLSKDYNPFKSTYKIAAGESFSIINVEVIRNPLLISEPRILTIRLKETDELSFLYTRKAIDTAGVVRLLDVQRVIKMTEDFPQPFWWRNYGVPYFGKWSVEKSILVCDVMGIDREVWLSTPNGTDTFTEGFLKYAGLFMHRYLQAQNPKILEKDGSVMEMGVESKR